MCSQQSHSVQNSFLLIVWKSNKRKKRSDAEVLHFYQHKLLNLNCCSIYNIRMCSCVFFSFFFSSSRTSCTVILDSR